MDLQKNVLDPVLRETLFHISSLSAAQQQQLQQFLSASTAPQAANTANTAYTADITPLHSSDSPVRYYKLQGTYAFDPSYRMASSEPIKVEQFVLTNFRSFSKPRIDFDSASNALQGCEDMWIWIHCFLRASLLPCSCINKTLINIKQ